MPMTCQQTHLARYTGIEDRMPMPMLLDDVKSGLSPDVTLDVASLIHTLENV